jgi:hypothetical protein
MGWPGAADCRTLCSSDRRQKEFLNLKPVNERPLRGSDFHRWTKRNFHVSEFSLQLTPGNETFSLRVEISFVSFRVKS